MSAYNRLGQSFVKIEGADDFLNWCANKRIPLVLHGHEHLQWTDSQDVITDKGNTL